LPLQTITLRPGVVKDQTDYAAKGDWVDANNVRFRLGLPETIGGWTKKNAVSFRGSCRSLGEWSALDGSILLGIGTHLKIYVEDGGVYFDITPIRRTVTLAPDPILTGAAGSGIITVHDVGHGAIAGDFVTFSGATTTDGITAAQINLEFQLTVVDVDNYTITTAGAATAGGTSGGGAAVAVAYQINVGLDIAVLGLGWGAGPYSRGTWGSSTSITVAGTQIRVWSQDNWGEDLVVNPRSGQIYYWDYSGGTAARAVLLSSLSGAADVPTTANLIMVSEGDRHLVALGCNEIGSGTRDDLLIRWSGQEDATVWTPSTVTSAGSYRLSSGSRIIANLRTRQETLIWTDTALHSMQYSGSPYTFSFSLLMDNTSILGPSAMGTANNLVWWMGNGHFYVYSGSVSTLPCPLRTHVFGNINWEQSFKVVCATNTRNGEVMWFYPSAGSSEVDRYVLFNYVDQTWSHGTLARTAWIDSTLNQYPIGAGAVGTASYLYNHENGTEGDGAAIANHVESADFDLEDGTRFCFVKGLIPDVKFLGGALGNSVNIVLKTRDTPGGTLTTRSTAVVDATTDRTAVRLRARQAVIRYESAALGAAWRAGATRLEIQPDGRK